MTMAADAADPAAHPKAQTASLFDSAPKVAILSALLAQAISIQKLIDVWRTGVFHDTDDAMRLAQVRDWLAGQSWFDMTATRFDAPQGVFMHWSRVVDVPLALLIRFFEVFTSPETAERLTRLTFPFMVHIGFFAALIAVGRKLMGPRATAVVAFIGLFAMTTTFQFLPGRIDHHAPQILLLMLIVYWTLDALDGGGSRAGFLAGSFAMLSLAISVENLPFIVAMAIVFGVAWIARGAAAAGALMGLGLALIVSNTLLFVATVGPERYGHYELDAFSTAYWGAGVAIGLACLTLWAATARARTIANRAIAAGVACVALIALLAFASPDVLRDPKSVLDPFGGLDPLVRQIWLANVLEVQPLWRVSFTRPADFLPVALPMLAGLAAICFAIRADRERRPQWLAILAFGLIAIVTASWAVRAASSGAPILALGGAWAVLRVANRAKHSEHYRLVAPIVAAAPFVSITWAMALAAALPPKPATANAPSAQSSSQAAVDPDACFATANLRALDQLAPSKLLTLIDYAGYILADTHHSIVSGGYHRANHGNRLGIETFLAKPDEARRFARETGARYLLVCEPSQEIDAYAALAPDGLAAAMAKGEIPDWLAPVQLKGTRFRAYEIR